MMGWFRRLFGKKRQEEPLKGRPPVRREKSYTADTGYVYQYFYEGYRESERNGQTGHEYIFSVSSDRVSRFPLILFLGHSLVEEWQQARERKLNLTEQYALVKMSLFQFFDERTEFSEGSEQMTITFDHLDEHAEALEFL